MVMARFCARVRKHPDLPSIAIKDVYTHPTIAAPRRRTRADTAASADDRCPRSLLAEILASVLERDEVPTDAHVFDDLGADSMLMARFCARVRKHPDLPSIAIKDVYTHPTITASPPPSHRASTRSSSRRRARRGRRRPTALAGRAARRTSSAVRPSCCSSSATPTSPRPSRPGPSSGSSPRPTACSTSTCARSWLGSRRRFAGLSLLPIALKWLLVGRWQPREFRVWGLAYLRFWIVKTLVRSNPLVLFAGSPIYPLYLRALGAQIGRGAVMLTGHVPVCTDLLTVGDGHGGPQGLASLRCYRAHDGRIQTGAVTIGDGRRSSARTSVLDIDTSMGDGAQLGHASSLHRGQAVPAGEPWHGSPARPTDVDYRTVAPQPCGVGSARSSTRWSCS